MEGQQISQAGLKNHKIAIIGYGNQGRAQALNLTDSGMSVTVGVREGKSWDLAKSDHMEVVPVSEAIATSPIVMFLLPDTAISRVYQDHLTQLKEGKFIGFSHGYAYHFKRVERLENCHYFLVAPKGAGTVLRENYVKKIYLPMAYAVESDNLREETEELALTYAESIGCKGAPLRTNFQEECESDLFGEQSVLCGGLMSLMENAFEVLIEKGHSPEMAFYECCYEVQRIMDVFLKFGPSGMADRISQTAFFGGVTRKEQLFDRETFKESLRKVFDQVRSGEFAKEWEEEEKLGMPTLSKERLRVKESLMQKAFERLKERGGLDG